MRLSVDLDRPPVDSPILVPLWEQVADPPDAAQEKSTEWLGWHQHEQLVLWPVDDAKNDRIRFVDILTDSDADGVGDVNELLAGTSPENAAESPGISTIDVLALYDGRVVEAFEGYPFTRIHHVMVLTNAIFADSATNIRMRTVGMSQVEYHEDRSQIEFDGLLERFGADVSFEVHAVPDAKWPCPAGPTGPVGGCSWIGSYENRGLWNWNSNWWTTMRADTSAGTLAHEMGHMMGLLHSAHQGEADGAFRWSRGHFLENVTAQHNRVGTLMSYGNSLPVNHRFSSPEADCLGQPCGISRDEAVGADAVSSLDLIRHQIAAHRDSKPDSDGDGFIDLADAVPDDPHDWVDIDGDGLGDNADSDDDNDGVADDEDAFPLNPDEWADADLDGVGDNVDEDVVDLSPFRDPALRAVVENALGKASGAPITAEDLTSLTKLEGESQGIQDLAGIELATNLEDLRLSKNAISDLSPLAGLTALQILHLFDNNISDVSPLSELALLRWLALSLNEISNLEPLSNLTRLQTLSLQYNAISDLSPLSGLPNIQQLYIGGNDVTLEDVHELPYYPDLYGVGLAGMGIEDLSVLLDLRNPIYLSLSDNLISDLSPLTAFSGIRWLQLWGNEISDIAPLVDRAVWEDENQSIAGADLDLRRNSLNAKSLDEHVRTLQIWGVEVLFDEPAELEPVMEIAVPDPVLRALIAQTVAENWTSVDSPITAETIARLKALRGVGTGIADLTGLETATNLEQAYLGDNLVTDLNPLSDLPVLSGVDLSNNRLSDISPLVDNTDFADGDWVTLNSNPLSEESLNTHVPTLLRRGVEVRLDAVQLAVPTGGEGKRFNTSGYFAAVLGGGIQTTVEVSDPTVATAQIVDGVLVVTSSATGIDVTVKVTATDENGRTATLTFNVSIREAVGIKSVALFPPAADPVRQGFIRVINRTDEAGEIHIEAIDDAGTVRGPLKLVLDAREAVHFNSDDLETGNADKGLTGSAGPGEGNWRLKLESDVDVAVLSYIRTEDGFLTAMHDFAPVMGADHDVAIFNPGSNRNQVSQLRLVNPGEQSAEVTITGIDDKGQSPGGTVSLSLGAGTARTLSAQVLESGEGLTGALGDGAGKWRLTVTADKPIVVKSLLESPTGHLTNLSTVPDNQEVQNDGDISFQVPLFLSAADPKSRQGFVRVINRGSKDASVRIMARDETEVDFGAVTFTVNAGSAVHFNSDDLELGNAAKGMSGGIGAGTGNWRLKLLSGVDLDVLAYIRTEDGFLTSMHDVVPLSREVYAVPMFNPGSNRNQASRLRIVNPGERDAVVTIEGHDDAGAAGESHVRLIVPAGRSLAVSAQALEEGGDGLDGRLGDGQGKWRLIIRSDQSIQITSLLESPTGHLTNLSTVPVELTE